MIFSFFFIPFSSSRCVMNETRSSTITPRIRTFRLRAETCRTPRVYCRKNRNNEAWKIMQRYIASTITHSCLHVLELQFFPRMNYRLAFVSIRQMILNNATIMANVFLRNFTSETRSRSIFVSDYFGGRRSGKLGCAFAIS